MLCTAVVFLCRFRFLGFSLSQEELRGKGLEEFNQKDRKEKQEKRQFGLDQ